MYVQALPTLSFGEAIRTCFSKYCTFSGRARRSEFWLFYIFVQIIITIIIVLFFFLFFFIAVQNISQLERKTDKYNDKYNYDYSKNNYSFGPGFFVLFMITLFITFILSIPVLSAGVRRLHDTGKSGWYSLLYLVPFGNIVLLIFFIEDSQQMTNEYGPSPKYVVIQNAPLMNNSMAIPVAGIPQVNPYPYPLLVQFVQYPPQNVPVPSQQNLYQGNAQEVHEAAPNTQEQLATPMVVP